MVANRNQHPPSLLAHSACKCLKCYNPQFQQSTEAACPEASAHMSLAAPPSGQLTSEAGALAGAFCGCFFSVQYQFSSTFGRLA